MPVRGAQGDAGEGTEELNAEMYQAEFAAYKEFLEFKEELDIFYSYTTNQKSINHGRVFSSLERGQRTYGVIEVTGDLAYYTGIWQRVEIMGIKVGIFHNNLMNCN
ncbi:unnamed protein product [Gongylonema pulchrum]|uniref:Uncharacterized protein n=1 Tax=Gongylonema pulchrum TaxID=637853 RepID=A0A3P6R4C0_9BILA|nr:unnamed protein product [Gongylonema pulchrum]